MELFDITEADLIVCNRSKEEDTRAQYPFGRQDIDYHQHLKKYFTIVSPDQEPSRSKSLNDSSHFASDLPKASKSETTQGYVKEIVNDKKFLYKFKDHLILGKEIKNLEKYKHINDIQVGTTNSHLETNQGDNLVLTRKLNHPELIYNQRVSEDVSLGNLFKVDANECWTLSPTDECFVCEKHLYTMIFYDRHKKNSGLVEIKDMALLDLLKREYFRNIKLYRNYTPLICGTVVKKGCA